MEKVSNSLAVLAENFLKMEFQLRKMRNYGRKTFSMSANTLFDLKGL